ncbi:hypothetical protein J6590_061216 [Homalodisca vitripennis]|nr:hypothetical protein J6590_061216 [Homalodisca vitripennis]
MKLTQGVVWRGCFMVQWGAICKIGEKFSSEPREIGGNIFYRLYDVWRIVFHNCVPALRNTACIFIPGISGIRQSLSSVNTLDYLQGDKDSTSLSVTTQLHRRDLPRSTPTRT